MVQRLPTSSTGRATAHGRSLPLAVCLGIALLALAGGCSTNYLTIRKVPQNPLAGPLQLFSFSGPRPTPRTQTLLRRYDLDTKQPKDPGLVLASLDKEILHEPTAEKLYSFAELAYVDGKAAENTHDLRKAIDCYGAAVAHAYMYLFDARFDHGRNPYDPQFRQACDVYNGALEAAMRIWKNSNRLKPGMTERMVVAGKEIELTIDVRGNWPVEEIENLEFVSDFAITGLRNRHHTYGLGVPLIGVRRPADKTVGANRYYPRVLAFPVTAFLRVEQFAGVLHAVQPASTGTVKSPAAPTLRCVLELHDPLTASDIQVANRVVPLETDLSTPLAYLLDRPALRAQQLATIGLRYPDEVQAIQGIYMLEPFDPHKIPVIMVHGLWSSPMTWMEQFNDLRAMPEIRDRYQFWFYLYPTGQPFWLSATSFRRDLQACMECIDPAQGSAALRQMVLVGHSMGGLVSMMQTLESGDRLWRMLSDKPFDELKADDETRARLAATLFFQPNPSVARVITIGTPHRGSNFANDTTRWLSHYLIDMPNRLMQTRHKLLTDNPQLFRNTELLTITTSIDSLSPEDPVFHVLEKMPRAPWVHYHNVIGLVSSSSVFGKFSKGSDGVVSYDSARLDDVDSELVVEADHTHVHRHPRAILEVRRILLEHAAQTLPSPTAGSMRQADAVTPAGAGSPLEVGARQ